MPSLFRKEVVVDASQLSDTGKADELDSHELLQGDDQAPIATFDQIRAIGKWFLEQNYNTVLASDKAVPQRLLARHDQKQGGAFLAKLATSNRPEDQFPVTVQPVLTPQGWDLRLHIVPIHFGALEVAQYGQHSDSLMVLAAAAAVAPQFLFALESGIETTHCASKKAVVTTIAPDHGTPLATTFDLFNAQTTTLDRAIAVTHNPDLSIRQAAHLHGQDRPSSEYIATAAAASKIAAGVPITSVMRSELNQRHVLLIPTATDPTTGETVLVDMRRSLHTAGLAEADLPFVAAALGFTAQVVGDARREQTIERVLTPSQVDLPLREVITG